jgi:anti-sigma factor RsiW
MKDCDFQPLLGPYHDGELDSPSVERVERHLPECPACAAELTLLRGMSTQIAAAPGTDIDPAESARLHSAIDRASNEADDIQPLFRTAGLLAALAASVLIVSGVWLLDTRGADLGARSAGQAPASMVVSAPEWERVAVTLRAEPRSGLTNDSVYAPRYASTVQWMLDGLIPTERKPWAKPKS